MTYVSEVILVFCVTVIIFIGYETNNDSSTIFSVLPNIVVQIGLDKYLVWILYYSEALFMPVVTCSH